MHSASPSLSDAEIAAIAARIDRPIVLVGLMGVGKSTVGRKLAALLKTDFVDADEAIETAAAMPISDIFESFGEDYFRDGERRVIARLIEERHGVIATGGGAFVHPETRALVLASAIAVWIDCAIDTLVERTSRRDTRPLLKNGDPAEILTRLHGERAPYYGEAPIRVKGGDGPQLETALQIIEAIERWL
ncbi:shikimate kinase [Tsuneonella sp. YG55]|uniref:Shikimate kinase n=1 Tax=Tsuneonella litorea TaxID=2976475 RepID=A0A9X2W0G3_9SPHN|nr:shikimate kinase [Tsuneonella litorea]MCT2558254.1 shikimate kinase [Tsuneonella litorea]